MRAPRQQLNFNEAHIFVFREHAVFCLYFFRTVCLTGAYFYKILLFVFCQPAVQSPVFFLESAVDNAEIEFFYLSVLELLVHDSQGFCVLCGHHYSAGVAVDSVYERGRKRVFVGRIIFALFVEIALYPGQKSVVVFALVRVRKKSDFFVEQHYILVFVDDREIRRSVHEIVSVEPLLEKFVVYVHIHFVALFKARGYFAPFAVELYALESDVFVHQRIWKIRNGLFYEFVNALIGVVFPYSKTFQLPFLPPDDFTNFIALIAAFAPSPTATLT